MAKTNEIRLTPRKHAQLTFYPTSKQKNLSAIELDDVDVVIGRGAVLVAEAVKTPFERDGTLIIELSEGRLELIQKEWLEWKKGLKQAESVFDITRIIREYESDN
jgi:hypothetical protein